MALTITNRFTNGQKIDAEKFNSNFSSIVSWAAITDDSLTTAQSDITDLTTDAANVGKGVFLAYTNNDQSLSATTWTTVSAYDTSSGGFDPSSWYASNVYTPQVPGTYALHVTLAVAISSGSPTVIVTITKNSTRYAVMTLTTSQLCGSATLLLASDGNDDFKIEAYASAANASIDYVYFTGHLVRPTTIASA